MIPFTLRVHGKLAMAAAILLCLGAHAFAEDTEVTIDNFTFSPAELTVKVGTTVTWKNHDDIPHTVMRTRRGAFATRRCRISTASIHWRATCFATPRTPRTRCRNAIFGR